MASAKPTTATKLPRNTLRVTVPRDPERFPEKLKLHVPPDPSLSFMIVAVAPDHSRGNESDAGRTSFKPQGFVGAALQALVRESGKRKAQKTPADQQRPGPRRKVEPVAARPLTPESVTKRLKAVSSEADFSQEGLYEEARDDDLKSCPGRPD
jgi:hypothetical protein